jgi:hypothetical protein
VSFNLDDYVDVAERIRLFYAKYPEGSLVTAAHGLHHVGERTFIYCEAKAYRTADDTTPCSGTAWEPIPGPTPYTKDSELMNAETAAWGRAIIAAGIPSKKIASSQEVRARADGNVAPSAKPHGRGDGKGKDLRTKEQNAKLHAVLGELDELDPRPEGPWKDYAKVWIENNFGKTSSTQLTKAEAGKLIDHLEGLAVPFG